MKFSQILLAALFITSCNDSVKTDPENNSIDNEMKTEVQKKEINNEKISDCLKNLREECVTGKWTLKTIKLNEKGSPESEFTLTEAQKDQYIEIVGNKVSGKIYIFKEEELSLIDDPIIFSNIDYSLFEDKEDKKIRFQINQNKIESTIKTINKNILTLVRPVKAQLKEYIVETIWEKK